MNTLPAEPSPWADSESASSTPNLGDDNDRAHLQATTHTPSSLPPEILLVIFIHGFKGTDTTFGSFPNRLQHVLTETIEGVTVECIVFPAYETKGELDKAVERFADWLTTLAVEREVANGAGGGAGKAKIILCGHSMGGLLAADSLLAFLDTRPDPQAPLWPNIIACLAFDTPYLGLHPGVFKNSATKAAEYAQAAREVASGVWGVFGSKSAAAAPGAAPAGLITAPPTAEAATAASPWAKWAPAAYTVGGALLAGAAAGTAYYKRTDITSGYGALSDHMKYVGTLWDEKALGERVVRLVQAEEEHGVFFRTFYTLIPQSRPAHPSARTFIILPKSSMALPYFLPANNNLAPDEVQAHMGMFEAATNDGYYQLGLDTAGLIRQAVMKSRKTDVSHSPSH
ncbi:hypothetical protein BV25DRAFT_1797809 [Artomyces pyxidatus]|uniref:Uncharacterized protein n=1 Tax=Artomyces pyxidatus TaxID=48021 RepID=A0ACB8TD09_9AGAM|nr:hypothetical protein BV25DRAFT_1797809 [Artomyces pyxidatus]